MKPPVQFSETMTPETFAEAPNRLSRLRKVITSPNQLWRSVLVRLAAFPFRLGIVRPWPGVYLSYIPDRYSVNMDKYRARFSPGFFDASTRKWLAGNRANNGGDLGRFFFLNLVCDQILREGLKGSVAELGVYKGNSAYLLARLAAQIGSTAYLFDTFSGFDKRDLRGVDETVLGHRAKSAARRFADTSVEGVRRIVGSASAQFVQGYFPESTSQLATQDQRYVLAHIDCDLEAPFTAALQYFYPRLVDGGWLVMHDYSSLEWEGVARAVDSFFADKPEKPVPIPDKSGTVAVRKCSYVA
jgi:hypothetical protein